MSIPLGVLALAAISIAFPASAEAQQGVYLPQAPHGSGGEDVVETPGGTRCRSSLNSNGAYLDFGLVATTHNSNGFGAPGGTSNYGILGYGLDTAGTSGTGYARLTIPLGKKPKRIDCSELYELEIARMRREIELLKMAAE